MACSGSRPPFPAPALGACHSTMSCSSSSDSSSVEAPTTANQGSNSGVFVNLINDSGYHVCPDLSAEMLQAPRLVRSWLCGCAVVVQSDHTSTPAGLVLAVALLSLIGATNDDDDCGSAIVSLKFAHSCHLLRAGTFSTAPDVSVA